ncbi:hypothetical protein BG004_004843 [Podila humilis]|nr:hypothetical protein BG004_004843 [Podila humilis]
MSSQNDTHSNAVDNPENGVQRFQSQDKIRLQSLRGRYSGQLQCHYLVWNDIVAAFPNIDYLLIPTSHCLFLMDEACEFYDPLRIPVSEDDIATVVNRSVPHSEGTDNMDQDLLFSDNCVKNLDSEALSDSSPVTNALSTLSANSLVDLYIKLKMGMHTLKNILDEMENDEEERHIILQYYYNMLQRHERLLASVSLLEDVGSSIQELQDDLADNRASLDVLHRAILAFEVSGRLNAYVSNTNPEEGKYPYYPLPYFFILLPADGSTWIPNDPRTHTYRIHFLCIYEAEGRNTTGVEGFHFMDHPGYDIRDWDGFLKVFGHFAMTIMQSIQYTVELDNKKHNEDEKINVIYQALVDGSSFGIQEIRMLLDMAIKSLRKIVRVQAALKMDVATLRKLKTFLEDEDMGDSSSTNKWAGLYPDWNQNSVDWTCSRHFFKKYEKVALDTLKSSAVSLDGDYDMALGVATIKAHSLDQVTEFLLLLKGTEVATDLTICMLWDSTTDELMEVSKRVHDSTVGNLFLESAGFKDHPFYSTELACRPIHNLLESTTHLVSITFANIVNQSENKERSTQLEYVICTKDRRIVTTSVPTYVSNEWDHFKLFMMQFPKSIGYGSNNERKCITDESDVDEDEHDGDQYEDSADRDGGDKDSRVMKVNSALGFVSDAGLVAEGMALMARLRKISAAYPSIQSLGFLSAYRQVARFDMRNGTFQGLVNARFPVTFNEQLLYVGTLRQFVVEAAPFVPNCLSTLGKVLVSNPELCEVRIGAKESVVLSQIVFCCHHLRNQKQALHFTFYDDLSENEERVIAELMLSVSRKVEDVKPTGGPIDAGMEDLERQGLDLFDIGSVHVKVLQWAVDIIDEDMSDDEAAVLDMITGQVPDTLHRFELNVQEMTRIGIKSLERVFSRSKIQTLKIKCCSIESDMEEALVSALAHLNRSMLVSLQLRGDHIDAWLQILPQSIVTRSASTSTTTTTPTDMQMEDTQLGHLVQFEVVNTAVDRRPLSDRAKWVLFQIMHSSSRTLLDIKFENMDLLDAREWALLVIETAYRDEDNLRIVNCNTVEKL